MFERVRPLALGSYLALNSRSDAQGSCATLGELLNLFDVK